MLGTTTQRVLPAICSSDSIEFANEATEPGPSLVPSANTITPGRLPRRRRIETPSGAWREIETDCSSFHPDRAPGRYGRVPSPSESPIANTVRSRTTSRSRSTARPRSNQASW